MVYTSCWQKLWTMEIAVTITYFDQLDQDRYDNVSKTKIFKSSQTIDEMLEWANRHQPLIKKEFHLEDLQITAIED